MKSHHNTSFLKRKYLFISYFVSKYQQKFLFSDVIFNERAQVDESKQKAVISTIDEKLNYLVLTNYDLTKMVDV